jgi:hypothetical protein
MVGYDWPTALPGSKGWCRRADLPAGRQAESGSEAVGPSAVTNVSDRPAETCALSASGGGWPRATRSERVFQVGLAAGLAGLVALGAVLTPSPEGVGTHTALGLPACRMILETGHPCPTCGVTTAFALASHGRWWEALVTQPLGFVLFLGVVGGIVLNVAAAAAGRSWFGLVTVQRAFMALMVLVALTLVSWGYKWSVT